MRFLSDLKVAHRLLILVLAFVVWGLIQNSVAFHALTEVQVQGPLYERLSMNKDLVADILPPPAYIVESNLAVHELVLARGAGEIEALEQRLRRLQRSYEDTHARWTKAGLPAALHDAVLVVAHEPAARFYRTASETLLPAVKSGNQDAARAALATLKSAFAEHRAAIDRAVELGQEEVRRTEALTGETLVRELVIYLGVAGLMSALIFGFSYIVGRGITRPLARTVKVVRTIADGDLTRPVPQGSRDEFGQLLDAMRTMQANLNELVGGIQRDARELAGAAIELSEASQRSAQASETQSDAASRMAASVEQMSASIEHVGDNARTAEEAAQRSGEESRRGSEVIAEAASEMRAITASVTSSAGTIRELEGYTAEISTIASVIKDIADQTNLLALNAAIEAARAGEQGRGFAVVADEVRKLAERTGQSTEQIGRVIEKVQGGTRHAVDAMEAGVSRVDEGMQTAERAGTSVAGIRDSADRVVELVRDIARALKEQSAASQDIAQGVEHFARSAEESAGSVRQSAAAAQRLEALSSALTRSAGRFRT